MSEDFTQGSSNRNSNLQIELAVLLQAWLCQFVKNIWQSSFEPKYDLL